mmetsp:Transcript_7523/g.22235  ORF Transcript_7523/g.22235 Transcript_7523/m.22235 type:complete len:1072 (+) Transcript_7523:1397-4612(+)
MSRDHAAQLDDHLADQALDKHGVAGGGGIHSDIKEDPETIAQPREFLSPDEIKLQGGGSSGGAGGSGGVMGGLSSGNSGMAIDHAGGGAVADGISDGGSKRSGSGGAGLLRGGGDKAADASRQQGAGAQGLSSQYKQHLIEYNRKQGLDSATDASGPRDLDEDAIGPDEEALLASGLIHRHGDKTSALVGAKDSSDLDGDTVRGGKETSDIDQGEDGAAISAAFDKPKPKGAANILAATDNKFVSAAQPDALDTDAETTSDGGSSRLDSGDSKFSNNKDDASAVGIGKATAPGRARNGSKGSSTTVTVQDAMDALSGGKVERSNGSKVKAKAKAKASESSLGGDAELADAGDAPEDREFGELADEPLEFDSIRSSSTAVRGGTAGDRGKDSRSGEDQARKSAVANSGGTSAEKATFEVGTNSIAKGGKARGDSRGGGSSGDKSAVTSTAKDDLEVTLDDGIDVVVPEASGKKGDLAIASEAAGKMAGKAAGKAASKDDLYEQGGTSSKKKDASTAADSLLDLPEDKAYNEVADSLTDAAGMKSKSKAGQSHGSTLEDDLNGELAGKGNGSRDSLGGLTTAIKTAAKSAGKSDLFEISESDTAGGSSSSTGNKKTGKLQQGNIRTVVDEEGLTGSAHDQERRELIGSEAASSKKGGSGNAHGSQIDSALADASLQDDLDSADAAKGSSAGKKGKAAGSDKDASSLLDAMNDAEGDGAASPLEDGGIGGGTTRGGSAVNAAGSRMSAELAALATAPGPSMQPKLSVKKQGQAKSTGGGGDEGSASALGKLGGNGGKTSDAMSDSKSGATKGRPLIEEDLVVEGSSIVVNKVAAAAGAAGKAAASVVAAASPLAEDAASTLLEAASTVTSAAGDKAAAVLSSVADGGATAMKKAAGLAADGAATGARAAGTAASDAASAAISGVGDAASSAANSALDAGASAAKSAAKTSATAGEAVWTAAGAMKRGSLGDSSDASLDTGASAAELAAETSGKVSAVSKDILRTGAGANTGDSLDDSGDSKLAPKKKSVKQDRADIDASDSQLAGSEDSGIKMGGTGGDSGEASHIKLPKPQDA